MNNNLLFYLSASFLLIIKKYLTLTLIYPGPPERIGTWGLVTPISATYINPILIRGGADYAYYIGLFSTKICEFPADL